MEKTAHHAVARDGTPIYWSSIGRGAPAVVLTDGLGCAGYVWRLLEPALAARHRVIHWNYRGHGRSGKPRDPIRVSIDDCVGDLLAVLDAAGEERAVLAGHSMGVQVALETHRRAPERVAALLLICGAPGHPIDTFHDSPALKLSFPFARAAVEKHPSLARLIFRTIVPTDFSMELALAYEVDRTRVDRADLVRYFKDLAAVDPVLFVRLLASAGEHDTSDHLAEVDVPTLIVAGERDTFTPVRLSRTMHQAIPGSELLVLPGATHVAPLEHPEALAHRVLAFLEARLPARRAPARSPRAARAARKPSGGADGLAPRPRKRAAGRSAGGRRLPARRPR